MSGARLGEMPGRAVVEGGLAWVDEVAAQLRVLHLLPETPIVYTFQHSVRLFTRLCRLEGPSVYGQMLHAHCSE